MEHQDIRVQLSVQMEMYTKNTLHTPATTQEHLLHTALLQTRTSFLKTAEQTRHVQAEAVLTRISSATQIQIVDLTDTQVQTSVRTETYTESIKSTLATTQVLQTHTALQAPTIN